MAAESNRTLSEQEICESAASAARKVRADLESLLDDRQWNAADEDLRDGQSLLAKSIGAAERLIAEIGIVQADRNAISATNGQERTNE